MKKLSLLSTVIFCSISSLCFSDTIHVPGDQQTIQAGIDAAMEGDTVLVAPGTYVENIDFLGKTITVMSSAGAEETVIENDGQLVSVVTFSNGETLDSVIKGFGITLGKGTYFELYQDSWYYCGGGVFCLDSSPTITDCVIYNNTVDGGGGGVFCYNASPSLTANTIDNNIGHYGGSGIYCKNYSSLTVANSIISGNGVEYSNGGGIYCGWYSTLTITNSTITGNTSHSGGGIYCYKYSSVTITDNTISLNDASGGGGINVSNCEEATIANNIIVNNSGTKGGGIKCYGDGDIIIENNVISKNLSGGGVYVQNTFPWALITNNIIEENHAYGGGGGISCHDALVKINKNSIYNNTTSHYGGGIYCYSCSAYTINNMICGNEAETAGGGIHCAWEGKPFITNNTIAHNSAPEGGGICCKSTDREVEVVNTILWGNEAQLGPEIALVGIDLHSTITVNHSDIQGGQSAVYVKPGSTLNWGVGMIDEDPFFACARNMIHKSRSESDFHLTYLSPCRNVGDNSAHMLPSQDFENDPRIVDSIVDMGADEFHRHFYCTGEFIPGGSIVGKFVGMPGSDPVFFAVGSGVLHPPLQHKWGLFYLESPWIYYWVGAIPSNGVISISANISGIQAPYDIPMQALIGWKFSNLYVLKVLRY